MASVYFTVGAQGSGKTTLAKKIQEDKGFIRCNRDDLRKSLFGKYEGLSNKEERIVTETQIRIMHAALGNGRSVIVDDTNSSIIQLCDALEGSSYKKFVLFIDTPLDECLRRNSLREEKIVPDKIIRRTHARTARGNWLQKNKVTLEDTDRVFGSYKVYKIVEVNKQVKTWHRQENRENAYVFDIDGTIAHNVTGRSFYDLERVIEDKADDYVCNVLDTLHNVGYKIVICSGREDASREVTEKWLNKNKIHYDELFMRKSHDHREDSIIKEEIFDNFINPHYNVLGWFDDRISVSRKVSSLGLPLFRVGHPDLVY